MIEYPWGRLVDKTDINILKELVSDARVSCNEISRKIGVAVGTVVTRIRNLEKQGIIKGYSTILDPEKVGYEVTAIIEIIISKGKLLEVDKEIAKNPNVYGVYDVTGSSDAIVIARFKNRTELSEFIKTLRELEFVERTLTHVALGTIKEDLRVHV